MKNRYLYLNIILLVVTPLSLYTAEPQRALPNDGKLAVYNYHENQFSEINYRDGKGYIRDGLTQINQIFRSHGDGSVHPIDTRLIELVDHIQDHFGAETVELISGYRSPVYNKTLRDEGRKVASESLHLKGIAADIHLDEIRDEELYGYARSLKLGGVGFYPKNAFVHVDLGEVCTWKDVASARRVLLGTQNNPNPSWSAVTDKDIYEKGTDLKVELTNNDYSSQKISPNVWIEHFRKGEWGDEKKIEAERGKEKLKPSEKTSLNWKIPDDSPFGKFRLTIFTSKDPAIPPVYSNEFYIKLPQTQ